MRSGLWAWLELARVLEFSVLELPKLDCICKMREMVMQETQHTPRKQTHKQERKRERGEEVYIFKNTKLHVKHEEDIQGQNTNIQLGKRWGTALERSAANATGGLNPDLEGRPTSHLSHLHPR